MIMVVVAKLTLAAVMHAYATDEVAVVEVAMIAAVKKMQKQKHMVIPRLASTIRSCHP